MADYPTSSANAGVDSLETANYLDYSGAIKTVRGARSVFLLLLILSLLAHIGIYCAARWTNVLQTTETVKAEIEAPSPEVAHGTIDLEEPVEELSRAYYAIELALPLTEFIGQISCGALLLCYLLAVNVALSGRLGGVRGSISAFFWTVVLLALLFPWDRWLGGLRDQIQVPGVYFSFAEIKDLPTEFAGKVVQVLHYVRFLGYPVLALIIALVGDRRYAKGFRLAQRQVEAHLNVKPS